MTRVMMMLAPYPFMLRTAAPQTIARRSGYRWERQARIGRKPANQFLGAGLDEITLSGEILPHFAGGYGQLDAMRALAGCGKPLLLVSGRGHVLGEWGITEYGGDRGGISALIAAVSAIQTVAGLL